MAKQIKPDEETVTTQETQAPVPAPPLTPAPTIKEENPEAYVLSVLQAFPAYEQLYVDKHGGPFIPDTPESLREMATLYRNPYFTKP